MNRTEMVLHHTGYTSDRLGTHITKFKKLTRPQITTFDIVDPKLVYELEQINKEASFFPPLENWIK